MKKIGKMMLTAGLVLALAGCGSSAGLDNTGTGTETATEAATETAAESVLESETVLESQPQSETESATRSESEFSEPETVAEVSYDGYLPVLDEIYEEYRDYYSEFLPYSVYDMDGDGVKELIVKCGTCEADYMWRVYTLDGGETAVLVGEFSGWHSELYNCADGGLYNLMAHMGGERISHVTLANGVIGEEVILEKEIAADESYEEPDGEALETAEIVDDGLVRQAGN